MPAKERRAPAQQKKAASTRPEPPPKLSTTEADVLWHMAHGYQLETSSLGDNPILRRLKDGTEVRATANRRTIESLQQSGFIAVAKAGGVLSPTVWRLTPIGTRKAADDARRA